jgi:hypothetical protein
MRKFIIKIFVILGVPLLLLCIATENFLHWLTETQPVGGKIPLKQELKMYWNDNVNTSLDDC